MSRARQRPKKRRFRKFIIVILALFLIFSIVSIVGVITVFSTSFPRYDFTDRTSYLIYEDIDGAKYPRTEHKFMSGDNELTGYVYGEQNNSKGLIVISHGLGGHSEGYLAETLSFVDNGWKVFAFDNTGSGVSEGKSTKGLPQSRLDLNAALTYIEDDSELGAMKKMLYGHSWGGYAVASILDSDHDIAASVSVAGYDEPMSTTLEQAKDSMGMGFFANIEYPYIWLYNKFLFRDDANLKASDAINNSDDTPILIIHGENDEVIKYNGSSIIAQSKKINNPNAEYLTFSEEGHDGHMNLLISDNAIELREQFDEELKALQDEHGKDLPHNVSEEFFSSLDKIKMNELNPDFINPVIAFFETNL